MKQVLINAGEAGILTDGNRFNSYPKEFLKFIMHRIFGSRLLNGTIVSDRTGGIVFSYPWIAPTGAPGIYRVYRHYDDTAGVTGTTHDLFAIDREGDFICDTQYPTVFKDVTIAGVLGTDYYIFIRHVVSNYQENRAVWDSITQTEIIQLLNTIAYDDYEVTYDTVANLNVKLDAGWLPVAQASLSGVGVWSLENWADFTAGATKALEFQPWGSSDYITPFTSNVLVNHDEALDVHSIGDGIKAICDIIKELRGTGINWQEQQLTDGSHINKSRMTCRHPALGGSNLYGFRYMNNVTDDPVTRYYNIVPGSYYLLSGTAPTSINNAGILDLNWAGVATTHLTYDLNFIINNQLMTNIGVYIYNNHVDIGDYIIIELNKVDRLGVVTNLATTAAVALVDLDQFVPLALGAGIINTSLNSYYIRITIHDDNAAPGDGLDVQINNIYLAVQHNEASLYYIP